MNPNLYLHISLKNGKISKNKILRIEKVGFTLQDFSSLGISKPLAHKISEYGVVNPTPIQEQAIPAVLGGKDIIAQAQTGTGKTFAFLLPILENIIPDSDYIQALIVTPTRELALQITEEVSKLTHDMEGIEVLAVYGGQDVEKQLKKLKKQIQIVVGTPGRLLDHIRRNTVSLENISSLVLDEADQMLHIGFLDEVEEIIKQTPSSRQTMLFSATIPAEVRKLAKKHMKEPEYIQIEKKQGPALSVKQIAIHTVDRAKQGTLIHLVETHRPYLAVVFCRTKRRVSKLYGILKSHGFQCDELHGDLSQAKREQVMKRFREGEIQLLIATDVAARGLDVEGVTHVFNYDIPQDSESYVHRIGRTGRAGMKGMAITLYSSADKATLDMIEKELSIKIPKQNIGNTEKTEKSTVKQRTQLNKQNNNQKEDRLSKRHVSKTNSAKKQKTQGNSDKAYSHKKRDGKRNEQESNENRNTSSRKRTSTKVERNKPKAQARKRRK